MPSLKVLPTPLPRSVLDSTKESLDLPIESLDAANAWLRSHPLQMTDDYEEAHYRARRETRLTSHEWHAVISLIFNIGFLVEDDSKLTGLVEDLRTSGLDEERLAKFSRLMNNLRFPQGRLSRTAWRAATSVVPVAVDMRAVCDLRAVFENMASADAAEDEVGRLQALVPIVLLSLDIQDESGEVRSVVVQLPDVALARLQRTLSNAALQLAKLAEIRQKTTI